MKTASCFISIILLVALIFSLAPISVAKPQWLKEGLTVTYSLTSCEIVTEIIALLPDNGVAEEVLFNANGTYSWRVDSLNGSIAETSISLNITHRLHDDEKNVFVSVPWNRSVSARIDVDSREAFALNGTSLGKVNYWMESSVQESQNVIIFGVPPDTANATVSGYRYSPLSTPAGEFDCWLLQMGGTIPGLGVSAYQYSWYDKATGMLLAAQGSYFDFALMLMGIPRIRTQGDLFSAPASFVLQSATISSSNSSASSTDFLKLSDYLPYIIGAVTVAAIPTIVYMTRRSKKKARSN
jgi:hypothetical protein